MSTNTELIARSQRVASELDDHNASMDRRARTCIRELVAALKSMEQAITDPENQPSQWGTVTLAMYQALETQLATERRHNERATNHLQDQRDALQAQLVAAQGQKPVAHQFQSNDDGSWQPFLNQKHYDNTAADGRWAIRALYAAPIPQQPAPSVQSILDEMAEDEQSLMDRDMGDS